MKLYYSPGACSLAPHIVLIETGAAFGMVKVDLATKRTEDGGDYRAVNPKGYVPALALDDGAVLTEAAVVLQYLADRAPQSRLAPAAGTMERYRVQEWLNFIAAEIHKGFGPLWDPTIDETARRKTVERLGTRFDFVAASLGGRSYLLGETFTVADAYLFSVLRWSPQLKVDLTRWPVLRDYLARIGQRPSLQAALRREGLA